VSDIVPKGQGQNIEKISSSKSLNLCETNVINQDWLLLAHKMYKTVNSIKLLELHVPNLELNKLKNNSMLLHLHLLPNYKSFTAIILFVDLKKQFNLEVFGNDYLTNIDSTYYLRQHTPNYNSILDGQTTVSFFNMTDFSSQKVWVNILDQNLNLSKQNR
jgi:hypothetical protein